MLRNEIFLKEKWMHEMLQLARMVVFSFAMCRYVYQEYISTRGKMKKGKA